MSEPQTRTLLPSGRSIVVHVSQAEEELLVQSPDGRAEVRIVLDADGAQPCGSVRLGSKSTPRA